MNAVVLSELINKCIRCGAEFRPRKPSDRRAYCSASCARTGHRRGLVRELECALAEGRDALIAFVERNSIPEPNTGCWLWLGPVQQTGYGYVVDPRQPIVRASMPRTTVHRIVCEVVYRPMADDEDARHLCHNKACVNPEHLVPGSRSENMQDSVRAGRWTFTCGEGNGRSKLTNVAVTDIRANYRRRVRGEAAKFSARYGVAQSIVRRVAAGSLWVAVTLLLCLAPSAIAAPPAPGSDDDVMMAPHTEWITRQHTTNGSLCCSSADGRPAQVRRVGDQWQVYYDREHWEAGTNTWLNVPPEAVLQQMSPMWQPIAWILYGQVRCLALSGAS